MALLHWKILLSFFDIEIDSNRVSDYVVKSISYNPPKIYEIVILYS